MDKQALEDAEVLAAAEIEDLMESWEEEWEAQDIKDAMILFIESIPSDTMELLKQIDPDIKKFVEDINKGNTPEVKNG